MIGQIYNNVRNIKNHAFRMHETIVLGNKQTEEMQKKYLESDIIFFIYFHNKYSFI